MPTGVYVRTEKHKNTLFKKGRKPYSHWTGKKFNAEMKKRISVGLKKAYAEGRRESGMQGRKHSLESRRKIGDWSRGNKCHTWKGGITPMNERIRKSIEYKIWRTAVFERDNYTCLKCCIRGGYLEADHIKPFALFPELRFDVNNGRTLCKNCHKQTDTYGYKIRNYVLVTGRGFTL